MRIKPNVTTAALLGVLLGTALLVSACSTGNFADSVARASKYFDNGKFRSATITLKNVLQDEPNNAQAWFVLGRVSLVQGQYAEATHQFRRARDIGTSHQQVDRLLAKALLGNGSFKKALDVLSRNESDEGKARAQDYVLRGRAYLGLGKLQQAKQAFDTALQARPDYPAALVGQARVAWHTGNAARAQKLLTRVTKANPTYGRAWMVAGNMAYNRQDCGDVIDVFKHIRSLDARALPPGQVFNARGHAAFCQLRQGKLDNAAANIDVLLKRGPENPYANYLKGLLAYLNKNYDKATAHVQKALAKVPNNLSGLVLSGMIKTAQGDLKGAQVQFTNAVKQAPDSVRARQLLASVYMRRGLPKQAVKVLQQALDQQATNAQVLAQLGQAAVRAGQRAKGLHYLQRSAHYSAGNSGMQVAVARHMAQAGDVDSALALLKQVGTGQGNKALKFALFKISLYVQNEQPGKAIGEAQSLVKKHPDKVWFVRLLARVYATVGQNANARRTLKDALQVNPNNASIHLDLGRLAMLEGDYRSANSIFQAVVDTHPANVSAVLALARSAVRLGHKERATSLVEKAAQLRPDSIGIRKTLTRAYLAQERPDDALRVVDSLIADAPDSARLHWLKSEVLVAAGQQKAALASLKKAVALAPDMLGLRFELAHMLFAQQQFISATSQLRKIREQRPAFVPAAVLLARVQLRQGQLQAALATADSLRASGKNIAASYTLRGELLQAQERYKKAAQAYAKAYAKQPNRKLALRLFKVRRQGELPHPEKSLQAWLARHPDDATILAALAHWHQVTGARSAAARQYRALLARYPKNAFALNNLALVYFANGDKRALDLARQAHKVSPHNAAIMDTLGWILVDKGHVDKGLQLLRQAAKGTSVPEIQYHFAVALTRSEASGDRQKAKKILANLLASDRSFESRSDAAQLLQRIGQ